MAKLHRSSPALPSAVTEEAPELCRLIAAWLAPDARRRTPAAEALAQLGGAPARLARPWPHPRTARARPASWGGGASSELLDEAVSKRLRLVLIRADSGSGKSRLVEHYLARCGERDGGVNLVSRCYPAERIAFRAIDGWVDGIASSLLDQRGSTLSLPPGALDCLAEVFPHLGRALGEPRAPSQSPAAEVLQRARHAFVGVIAALSAVAPVRLWADDLQWTDGDSLPLPARAARARRAADAPDQRARSDP